MCVPYIFDTLPYFSPNVRLWQWRNFKHSCTRQQPNIRPRITHTLYNIFKIPIKIAESPSESYYLLPVGLISEGTRRCLRHHRVYPSNGYLAHTSLFANMWRLFTRSPEHAAAHRRWNPIITHSEDHGVTRVAVSSGDVWIGSPVFHQVNTETAVKTAWKKK